MLDAEFACGSPPKTVTGRMCRISAQRALIYVQLGLVCKGGRAHRANDGVQLSMGSLQGNGFVTSMRMALQRVLAVVSLPAPKREAGTKAKSRSLSREKVPGSSAHASRIILVRESGTSDECFTHLMSSCTWRTSTIFTAASIRPRPWISAFQGAWQLGIYFRKASVSTRNRPGTFNNAAYRMNSSAGG